MKVGFFSGTSKRTKLFTLISVVAIILTLGLNFLLTYFTIPASLYLDMTPEGLYSLSSEMERECDRMFDKIEELHLGGKNIKDIMGLASFDNLKKLYLSVDKIIWKWYNKVYFESWSLTLRIIGKKRVLNNPVLIIGLVLFED